MKEGKKPKDRDLVPYTAVWEELGVIEELVCRGERIVIPEWRCSTNDVALRDWVVDLGHSAHQGVDATKRQLRVRLWFPGMDRAVERKDQLLPVMSGKRGEQGQGPPEADEGSGGAVVQAVRGPLGPPQDGNHILVIIDGLTRYPEVSVVKGTSAEDNIQAFS